MKIRAEYIWIDGQKPTAKMRSKTKILDVKDIPASSDDVPRWGFDGSSTSQATTDASDLDLVPVCAIPDPIRGAPNILVLCEVYHPDGRPHESNTRAVLRKSLKKYQKQYEPWFGFEQEYTLYDKDGIWPLRWPQGGGYPAPQGGYYCGVGSDEVFGTELIEAHTLALLDAGLAIAGTNAEVMASQWEFQIGGPNATASTAADHLWLARWILYRLGEHFGITVVEAMAAGCVPVVYNGGGLAESVIHTESGYLWKETKEALMHTQILADNIQQYKTMQDNAIKRSRNFSDQKFRERIDKLVEKII